MLAHFSVRVRQIPLFRESWSDMSDISGENVIVESVESNQRTPILVPGVATTKSSPVELVKVLHIVNGEHYAGAERVQDLLAGALPEFGFSASFVCLKPGEFEVRRQNRAASSYDMPMKSRFDLRPAFKIASLVRKENFALIHAHTVRSALIAAAVSRLTGVPFVYHVHSPTIRNSTRGFIDRFNQFVEKRSLNGASHLIAVSESMARHMIDEGRSPKQISVVRNGVPKLYEPPFRKRTDTTFVVGCVALFRPRKGLEVLLKSLALLRDEGYDLRFRAVGAFETPEYRRTITELAESLNLNSQIEWVGFTSDVISELAEMDVFVLPSLFGEGLPMVVLEAMAAGTPVVATEVEGAPEAIRDHVDGLLAKPGDPEDLARAIAEIIDGEADRTMLRENALRRQAEHFSDRNMAQGVAAVYEEVLNQKHARQMLEALASG